MRDVRLCRSLEFDVCGKRQYARLLPDTRAFRQQTEIISRPLHLLLPRRWSLLSQSTVRDAPDLASANHQ